MKVGLHQGLSPLMFVIVIEITTELRADLSLPLFADLPLYADADDLILMSQSKESLHEKTVQNHGWKPKV